MNRLFSRSIRRLSLAKAKRLFHASLAVITLLALLSAPGQVLGQAAQDPFVLLLKGVYQPVVHGPNLGLSQVDLNDGTYSITKIYAVSGIPGPKKDDKPVGDFYVQFAGSLAAYHVPGGSFSMAFTGGGFTEVEPDGNGGVYLIGTFELTILDATGNYRPFKGGHNHMVDRLHMLADGSFDEYCFCYISAA
jgi:hypothetical protein